MCFCFDIPSSWLFQLVMEKRQMAWCVRVIIIVALDIRVVVVFVVAVILILISFSRFD